MNFTGKILRLRHKYSKSLSWAENLNKLFTVLGEKFKFSAQDSDLEYLCWRCKNSPVSSHYEFLEYWNTQKSVWRIWQRFFHVYLMRGFQNYERNWILMMAFWATCKIAKPIQPIWQHIFAMPLSALKKPPWEFNFFHIFGIPLSSRHEKCCQMLERLFALCHHSRNILCLCT